MSAFVAELQVLLEGVSLPAGKQELLDHARREGAGPAELALLEALPDREYSSLDEVGEVLLPVQPARASEQAARPRAESGEPPGGSAYTDGSEAPGWVRDRPD
ncbi:MAG TPA: DUF2795 domain-containing protein [Gaiellaceae bacterium]|jgi:hypothetical protein|nr:DUF2795 domain-containing protein [Gaiellaceae bacterium]